MIKVTVMYPNTPGARFDHAYYRDKHMPLVKAKMGDHCKYYTVDKGLAGGAPGRDGDLAARWGLADGVFHQMVERLGEAALVGAQAATPSVAARLNATARRGAMRDR